MGITDETTNPKVPLELRELVRKVCEESNQEENKFMTITSFKVEKVE